MQTQDRCGRIRSKCKIDMMMMMINCTTRWRTIHRDTPKTTRARHDDDDDVCQPLFPLHLWRMIWYATRKCLQSSRDVVPHKKKSKICLFASVCVCVVVFLYDDAFITRAAWCLPHRTASARSRDRRRPLDAKSSHSTRGKVVRAWRLWSYVVAS